MRIALLVSLILALASATSAATVGRIVGGQETSISQYPFIANILHSHDSSFFMPACAGTILNTRAILTTASCWPKGFGRIQIRVGSSHATSGGTVLNINQVTYLGSYNPVTLENDISIMRTVDVMIFDSNALMPVGFADAATAVPDNSLVTIAGWGRTEVGQYSEQLRHAQVRIMNNRDCEAQSSSDVFISNNMICTTGSGSFPAADVCVGDNGSPVILNNVVVGLVTHPRCGHGRPSVHTRVSSFAFFISMNMNN